MKPNEIYSVLSSESKNNKEVNTYKRNANSRNHQEYPHGKLKSNQKIFLMYAMCSLERNLSRICYSLTSALYLLYMIFRTFFSSKHINIRKD